MVLLAVALASALRDRARLATGLAVFAGVVGAVTFAEHLVGFDVGVDRVLLPARSWGISATMAPGRMGPIASIGAVLLAVALVARVRGPRAHGFVASLALAVVALAALPITGYSLGADTLYRLARYTAISLPTSVYLVALPLALLASVPEREPLRTLLDDSAAGTVARRALPFLVLAPVALGLLAVRGHERGYYDAAMGAAALVLALIAMLTGVLWWAVAGVTSRERALADAEVAKARSDAELRAVETRAESVLEGISDGFVALDPRWRFSYVNGEGQRLLGAHGAPLVGRTLEEALPEVIGTALEAALRRVATTRATAEHVHASRAGRWFACRIYPATDGGVSVYFRDITAQRRAEERAFKGEQQASVLMSVLPGGAAFVVDRDLRYLLANGEALVDAGLTPADFVGRTVFEVLDPDDAAAHVQHLRAALAGAPFVHEHEQGARTYLTRGVPLRDQSGQVYAVLAVSHDISEHKRVEAELRDGDRRKDEFLATLAHELRNPLAPISNALEILKHGEVEPAVRRRLEDTMRRQVAHMVRLVDDLLDVSRITRNRLTLRSERIDLVRVVSDAIEVCRSMVDRAHHALTVTVPAEPITVQGDAVRLAQVVGNLLANAVKYTPASGSLSVSLSFDGESHAILTIGDSGIGIPREMLIKVFDLFVQVDRSLERTQEGLGIGLALAKRLVEMHGGTIAAVSDGPGTGSQFVVRLPVVGGDSAHASEAPRITRPALVARRILVVDDNREAADSLAYLLSLMGRDIQVAYDGIEAIEACDRFKPDAILLDIGLPRLNGYDACRAIREQPWGRDVVIVAVTGWGQEEDQRRAREAGFDGHLVKPIDPDVLTEAIATSAARKRAAVQAS